MTAQTFPQQPARERSADEDAALWGRFRGVLGEPVKPAGKSWLKLVPATPPKLNWTAFTPRLRGQAGRGEMILARTWQVGQQRFELGPDDRPWTVEDASRHFLDRVHRFDWLAGVMAMGETGHGAGLRLVDDWIATHGKFDGFSWRAGPCADRVWHWMACGKALFEAGDGSVIQDRQDCLFRQIDHLEGLLDEPLDLAATFRTLCILVVIAALQNDKTALAAASERLDAEIARQILPDGGHVSRSPERLLETALDLLAVRDTLDRTAQDVPKGLTKFLSRMGAMLAFFQAADGALLPFNGGGEGERALVNHAIDTIDPAIRKFSFSPKSGFQKLVRGELSLLLDVGPAPEPALAEAAHAGALGFELADGETRLVTSCAFTKMMNVDWQAAMRRTGAHSTLVLGGRDSAAMERHGATRLLVPVGPDGLSAKRLEEAEEIWLDAQHSGYKSKFGLLHRRRLFMAGDGTRLTGEDSLVRPVAEGDAEDNHPIPFDIRFHLHPGVRARQEGGSISILCESGNRWRFKTSHDGCGVEGSVYLGRGRVERTEQIVLTGRAEPNGDGTSPPNCVRWAFVREDRT